MSAQTIESGASAPEASSTPAEYLSFRLGDEEYGINIMKVLEIRNYEKVTTIANAPPHVKGVMNLRGLILPIIDMRLLLNVGEPTYGPFTIVIVMKLGDRTIGMVVDSVSDVIDLPPDSIKPAPDVSNSEATSHVHGIGTHNDRMVILLDIDRLMQPEKIGLADGATP